MKRLKELFIALALPCSVKFISYGDSLMPDKDEQTITVEPMTKEEAAKAHKSIMLHNSLLRYKPLKEMDERKGFLKYGYKTL